MTRFESQSLRRAQFRDVDLAEAQFHDVTFEGSTFRDVSLNRVAMIGVELGHAVIDGDVEGLVINGVEVAPLIDGELDRRHPGRALLRSSDPDELREGWALLEAQWSETTESALAHPDASLRLRVGGEWSFVDTLRHLVFATDSWLGAGVLGATTYHPLGIAGPWFDHSTAGLDPELEPSLADVLAARASRQALVREWLATTTGADLEALTSPPSGVPWPPPEEMSARSRLHVILNEEWWHRQFAVRDMARWPTA